MPRLTPEQTVNDIVEIWSDEFANWFSPEIPSRFDFAPLASNIDETVNNGIG
jgi:hypothetical protein